MYESADAIETDDLWQDEELEAHLASIAEGMAVLSDASEGPSGYEYTSDPFTSEEVDFSSNSWLLRLAQIQPWLHLDAPIVGSDIHDDAAAAAAQLFRSLNYPKPNLCYQVDDSTVRLTPVGAEVLVDRLGSASKLKAIFEELIERMSRRDATNEWDAAWEEEDFEHSDPEPIKAKADIWTISDFVYRANGGKLDLNPSYQRGDVWKTGDSQKLIESILRGIPLPSVIMLKRTAPDRTETYEVVDGKQRLTSILRFVGEHPLALSIVEQADREYPEAKFKLHFEKNYRKFRKLWKLHKGESLTATLETEYYFPFPTGKSADVFKAGALSPLGGKYYYEIKDEIIQVGTDNHSVHQVFAKTNSYRIPIIEYTDASPRQIHDVFHIYNKQGAHLNAEEIRNAVFHQIDLARLFLVVSGDNPVFTQLTPFLDDQQVSKAGEIADALRGYKFGVSRYKRSKLLGWLTAMLFLPSVEDGELVVRSTAKQIDALLIAIRDWVPPDDELHPLRDQHILKVLVDDLYRCIAAHSSADCWAPRFKDNDKGVKWQELQLVASLVGVFLAGLVIDEIDDILDQKRDELLEFTHDNPRPRKSQNKTQWAYIGAISLGILECLGVSEGAADKRLKDRYGLSCIPTLSAARRVHDAGA